METFHQTQLVIASFLPTVCSLKETSNWHRQPLKVEALWGGFKAPGEKSAVGREGFGIKIAVVWRSFFF